MTLGVAMTIEDTWGGDIVTVTIAHLAHSTPEKFRFSSTDFSRCVRVCLSMPGGLASGPAHVNMQSLVSGRALSATKTNIPDQNATEPCV